MSAEKRSIPCCGEQAPAGPSVQPFCGEQKASGVEFPLYKPPGESRSGQTGQTSPVPCPRPYWITGFADTAAGKVPLAGTSLVFRDILGSWKARWGINRMNYRIPPGLYGVGRPDETAPVLVTANFKMSFDRLRKELSGLDAWIMVLDTNGINVWCAAGKGTFGTAEIIKRIEAVQLSRVVSHRTIILPQLGAPGVAAHHVLKGSGFRVVYGPVRARDLKEFLKAGMKATPRMRIVDFGFMDRLSLTPIEVVHTLKPLAVIAFVVFIVHLTGLIRISFSALYPFIGAIIVGTVISPALLPWIPGRAFSLKGWITGLLWTLAVLYLQGGSFQLHEIFNSLALVLLLPAISAFLTLNFTGASTYTSLSGVRREMKFAMPAMIASASAGIVLWLTGLLV